MQHYKTGPMVPDPKQSPAIVQPSVQSEFENQSEQPRFYYLIEPQLAYAHLQLKPHVAKRRFLKLPGRETARLTSPAASVDSRRMTSTSLNAHQKSINVHLSQMRAESALTKPAHAVTIGESGEASITMESHRPRPIAKPLPRSVMTPDQRVNFIQHWKVNPSEKHSREFYVQ